jgi:hypothetical protein
VGFLVKNTYLKTLLAFGREEDEEKLTKYCAELI